MKDKTETKVSIEEEIEKLRELEVGKRKVLRVIQLGEFRNPVVLEGEAATFNDLNGLDVEFFICKYGDKGSKFSEISLSKSSAKDIMRGCEKHEGTIELVEEDYLKRGS